VRSSSHLRLVWLWIFDEEVPDYERRFIQISVIKMRGHTLHSGLSCAKRGNT